MPKHRGKGKKRGSKKRTGSHESSEDTERFLVEYRALAALVLEAAGKFGVSRDEYDHIQGNNIRLATSKPKNVLEFFVSNMEDYYVAIADNLHDVVFSEGTPGPLSGAMRLKTVFLASDDETKLSIWKQLNKTLFYAYSAKYKDKDVLETRFARFFIGNSFQKKFIKRSDTRDNVVSDGLLTIEQKLDDMFSIIEGSVISYLSEKFPSDWSQASPQFSRKILYLLGTFGSEIVDGFKSGTGSRGWIESVEELFDLIILKDYEPTAGESPELAKQIIDRLPYEVRSPVKRLIRRVSAVSRGESVSWNEPIAERIRGIIGDMSAFDALDTFIIEFTEESFRPVISGLVSILVSKNIFATEPDAEYIDDITRLGYSMINDVFEQAESAETDDDDDIFMDRVRDIVSGTDPYLAQDIRHKYMGQIKKYLDMDTDTDTDTDTDKDKDTETDAEHSEAEAAESEYEIIADAELEALAEPEGLAEAIVSAAETADELKEAEIEAEAVLAEAELEAEAELAHAEAEAEARLLEAEESAETKIKLEQLESLIEDIKEAGESPGDTVDAKRIVEKTADAVKGQWPGIYEAGKELFDRLLLKLVSSRKIYRFVIDATKPSRQDTDTVIEKSEVSDMSISTLREIRDLEIPIWDTVSGTIADYEKEKKL